MAWVLVGCVGARRPRDLRPFRSRSRAITEDMLIAPAAGHAITCRPNCIEYLVAQDSTSYWLHQAVLGNPMQPPPGVAPPVFVYRDALVRWITGTSFPVTIADFSLVPREVREDVEVLARFGRIAVGRRRGTSACPGR